MTYETITLNQLTNRASNAYELGDLAFFGPNTPDTFFSVQYLRDNGVWWNGFETVHEQEALAQQAAWNKMINADRPTRILIVTVKTAQPAIVEQVVTSSEEAVVASSETIETVETEVEKEQPMAQTGKYEVTYTGNARGQSGVAYRGNDAALAKAAVAAYRGKCSQVSTKIDGVLQYKAPWYWDRHEQYQQDQRAGKFDAAYMRDYINDLVMQGKHREAEAQRKAWGM